MKIIFVLLCQVVCHEGKPCVFYIWFKPMSTFAISDPVDSCSTELMLEAAVEAYEEWLV